MGKKVKSRSSVDSKKAGSQEEEECAFPSILLDTQPPNKLPHQHPEVLLPGHIWVLRNFLSQQECCAWIHHMESSSSNARNKLEYVQQRGTRYLAARECFRFHCNDAVMAHRLYQRLLVATRLFEQLPRHPGGNDQPVTFNPNIRIYKYEKGMSFGKHVDDSNVVPGLGVTRMTVLIYLSDCQGGATRFEPGVAFQPAAGAVLLHVHGNMCLEHQADPVRSGTKWVLRTDLVYNNPDKEQL